MSAPPVPTSRSDTSARCAANASIAGAVRLAPPSRALIRRRSRRLAASAAGSSSGPSSSSTASVRRSIARRVAPDYDGAHDRGRRRGPHRPARPSRRPAHRGPRWRPVQHRPDDSPTWRRRALPRPAVDRQLRWAAAHLARRRRRRPVARRVDRPPDDPGHRRARRPRRRHLPVPHRRDLRAEPIRRRRERRGGHATGGVPPGHARPGARTHRVGARGRHRPPRGRDARDGRPELPPVRHPRPRGIPGPPGHDPRQGRRGQGKHRGPRLPGTRSGVPCRRPGPCSSAAHPSSC